MDPLQCCCQEVTPFMDYDYGGEHGRGFYDRLERFKRWEETGEGARQVVLVLVLVQVQVPMIVAVFLGEEEGGGVE
jgi:hypothetical protein